MNYYIFGDRIIASNAKTECNKRKEGAISETNKNALFKSAKDCKDRIDEYFNVYLPTSHEVADIESLADFLGSTRDEIIALMCDKRFGKTLRIARNKIAKIKKQLAFGGKIPAAVLSFDLKNNHGYRDKPDENEAVNQTEQVVFKGKASDWAQ